MSNFDFSKVSLFIGIPAYQRWLAQTHIDSLDQFLPYALAARLNFAKNHIADTDVAQARNELVARFRMSEMPERLPSGQIGSKPLTHILMIDDDISFEPDVILRMIALGHPVVAGIVPKRILDEAKIIHTSGEWVVKDLSAAWPSDQLLNKADAMKLCETILAKHDQDVHGLRQAWASGLTYNIGLKTAENGEQLNLHVASDGTVEVDRVGSGFLLIERSVFDRIEQGCPPEAHSQFFYQSSGDRLGPADDGTRSNFFQRGLFGDVENGKGQYQGEDFFFSELCLRSGIPVRAYAPAAFGHFGQMVFQGQPLLLPKT